MVAQGTAAFSYTPATFKAWVCFETEATTLAQGWALVEVGYEEKGGQHGPTHHHPPRPPALLLTLDVLGVVNDKVSIPHNRQVHRQVADIVSLIGILLEAGTVVMLGVVGLLCHMEDQGHLWGFLNISETDY